MSHRNSMDHDGFSEFDWPELENANDPALPMPTSRWWPSQWPLSVQVGSIFILLATAIAIWPGLFLWLWVNL